MDGDGHVKNEDEKDIVDVLLSLQKENVLAIPLDRVCIKAITLDMFAAGTDTTSTALEWTMSELLRHPRVMKKLQNEVRGTVGNKTDITEDDLIGMHYLKAVIKEALRLHPPLPLLLPRISTQDVKTFAVAVEEITLANLVHKFDWALPGGARGEDLDMSESTGAHVHSKYPLKAVAIPYSC
ncbi:hypothetical protein COP2_045651 [Malus domestica]